MTFMQRFVPQTYAMMRIVTGLLFCGTELKNCLPFPFRLRLCPHL